MDRFHPHRRALLKTLAGGLAAATALPAAALARLAVPLSGAQVVKVPVEPTRELEVTVLRPSEVKGVAIFSTGLGGEAGHYPELLQALTGAGWLVLSPLHVDAVRHPRRAEFDQRAGFGARIADLKAAAAMAAQMAPGKPVVAVGHSYGSLFSMMLGGALDKAAPIREASVKAVLCASSPGTIPGLVYPGAYSSLATPLMMVTGTKDIVPEFVPDPAQHLVPFDTSPAGDKYLLVVKDGGHNPMGGEFAPGPEWPQVRDAGLDFLGAYGLGDAAARAELDALKSTPAIEVRRR